MAANSGVYSLAFAPKKKPGKIVKQRIFSQEPGEPVKPASDRDTISEPSLDSGGVPDPSSEYLALASQPPLLLAQPRNLLVVIDLNGTLVFRPKRHAVTSFIERPFARSFLSYCINTFKVVIWSSARPQNVRKMIDQLVSAQDKQKIVAIWGRDHFGLTEPDYAKRTQCYKRLSKIWNDAYITVSHPLVEDGGRWSQLNTVLVDDSAEKARSEPFNLIQISDFQGDRMADDCALPQVHDYINECSQQANVSAFIKDRPFKLNPDYKLSSS